MLFLGAMLLVAGCTQQTSQAPPPTDPDREAYRLEQEGQVPPLDKSDIRKEVDKVDTFEEMPVEAQDVSAEDVRIEPEVVAGAGVAGVSAADPKTVKIDGFRVQVFASADESQARSVSQAVAARTGQKAYVQPEDGMYKVRVGDCRSREEAEKLRNKCKNAGYSDAWIVMAPIIVESGKN